MKFCGVLLLLSFLILAACQSQPEGPVGPLTHGPLLGRQTTDSITVWARTKREGQFHVRYSTEPGKFTTKSDITKTNVEHDNTGTVALKNLKHSTKYYYAVFSGDDQVSASGSFKTLRDTNALKSALHPRGLNNFSF